MKILIPLDGTETAQRAFERGVELLSGMANVRATALFVHNVGGEGLFEQAAREIKGETRLAPEEAFSRVKSFAAQRAVEVDTRVVEGPMVETLLLEAARGFDLIVVPAFEKPSMRDVFTGTLVGKLARTAPCSVLVVRD